MKILLLLLLVIFNSACLRFLDTYTNYDLLDSYAWESPEFRAMELGPAMAKRESIDCEELAALMVEHDFDMINVSHEGSFSLRLPLKRPTEFEKLANSYRIIFNDLKYFPVPRASNRSIPDVSYEDSWMEKRTYGGERGHEGCDLMGAQMPAGFYPVISITDGTVEQVGWLEQGGWRIGIRAPSGAYFYYAHLAEYGREWTVGEHIEAGTLLGTMGDSGYGKIEGTTGNFPVHLHLGIYIKTDHYEEISINPYWILRYLEKYRSRFGYENYS